MKRKNLNRKIEYSRKSSSRSIQKITPEYIVLLLRKYIVNEKYKWIFVLVSLGILISDIFYSPVSSDKKFYGITILYFVVSLFYHLKSKITFIICFVLLFLMFINFLLSGASAITEKVAVWLFLFMFVGTIQQWIE